MLRDAGWVWEGIGLDPGVEPSIFGVGEGAAYFGLARACYLFHPNTELALGKLSHLAEVVCDITKWTFLEVPQPEGGAAFKSHLDGRPERVLAEAQQVARLAGRFPHLTGAILDDMSALINHQAYTPERHQQVYAALKQGRPDLRLWAVVYSHELAADYWRPYLPGIDVVNLWVWDSGHLPALVEHLERCRAALPGKPVVVGVYLRDYGHQMPVPLPRLQAQFAAITQLLEQGLIEGFSILGACLIDRHPEQAAWIRDYLAGR